MSNRNASNPPAPTHHALGLRCGYGVAVLAAVGLSRWALAPKYLYYFDSVNFALALEEFDPQLHQPQPPGYPLFVGLCRVIHWLVASPERVFLIAGILASAAAVVLLQRLGEQMFTRRVGHIAALLLLFNPPFWLGGISNEVRTFLALGAVAVALAGWKAYPPGSPVKWFYWTAVLLGIAGGFRPGLLIVEAPLLIVVGLHSRRSQAQWLIAASLLAVTVAGWLGVTIQQADGLSAYIRLVQGYAHDQFQGSSALFGAPARAAGRMAAATLVWSGIGILSWIWAVPFAARTRPAPAWRDTAVFLAAAFLPAFLFNAIVHVGDPDQVLAGVPVICLLGGLVISRFLDRAAGLTLPRQWITVGCAVLLNILLFFRPLPGVARACSYKAVRQIDRITRSTYGAIERLRRAGPVFVVFYDASVTWRNLSYYYPDEPILVLNDDPRYAPAAAHSWLLWRGKRLDPPMVGREIALPASGTLVWLVSSAREVRSLLRTGLALAEDPPLYYVRAKPGMHFRFGEYRFATAPAAGGAIIRTAASSR